MTAHKIVNGKPVPLSDEDAAHMAEEIAQWEASASTRVKADHNAPILAEIAALDAFLPRGVEDLIAVLGVDVTTLPQVQQDRLARKAALRAQLVR